MTENGATGVWGRLDQDVLDLEKIQLTELLHPVLAAAGVGAWRYERDAECFYFDELLRQLYEMPPFGPLSVGQILDHVHPDDRVEWRGALNRTFQDDTFHCRHRVVLNDGTVRWFDWTGRFAAGEDESDGVLGVCVDVTDEIEVQEKLAAEEKRFQAIASGVPGKFGYMDSNYLVQFLSTEYRLALGLEHEDVVGRHTRDVFGEEFFQKRRELLDRAIGGDVVTFEDSIVRDDGKTQFDIVTYQPDFDEHRNVCGIFTLRLNITNRRELEQNLRTLSDDLARSNADLEQFAYVASHDLKAPLRAIQVLVGWLAEDLKDYKQGEVQENLELLSKRTARLNQLLEDLLNYSRAGRQSESLERVDLGRLVGEVAELSDPRESVSIGTAGDPTTLMTDRAALHQVLRNLIGNAVKHHPGPSGQVTVSAVDCGLHHVISVADDGEGIPAEFSEKIFQMFQTLKPRDEVEGSGMGLAIVERIVRNQGGEVWFESPGSGKGTVFKFTWMKRQPDRIGDRIDDRSGE